jgi:nucleoside-diphosphate-sugar epimerase
MKIALISGTSGLVGMQLLHQLLQGDRYEYVLSIGRRKLALKHPKLIQLSGDMTQLEFWNYSELINEQSLGGEYYSLVEILENGKATIHAFSSLGTTIKQAGSQEKFFAVDHDLVLYFAKSVKKMGASGFFYVSSMGASTSSNVFYSKVKGQTEEDLKSLGFDHLGIFRPSLLFGNRHEFRFGEKVATIVMKPLVWLKLFKNLRPIYDYQVAKAMVSVALDQGRKGIEIISSGEMQDLSK